MDATFLAAAGLSRLGQDDVGSPLDLEDWLPAPAQGAIAIECRADDDRARELLSVLDHAPSNAEVMAERALLLALGGTCHSPIAVRCSYTDGQLAMRAALFSPAGQERVEAEARFAADDAEAPARLAAELLAKASTGITAVFSGPQG